MRNKDQLDWLDHWVGMPEFEQAKKEPFAVMNVRFETEADLMEFAKLIDQKLTSKTKSIWHPYKPHKLPNKQVYRD
jgi:hypothetical protein